MRLFRLYSRSVRPKVRHHLPVDRRRSAGHNDHDYKTYYNDNDHYHHKTYNHYNYNDHYPVVGDLYNDDNYYRNYYDHYHCSAELRQHHF